MSEQAEIARNLRYLDKAKPAPAQAPAARRVMLPRRPVLAPRPIVAATVQFTKGDVVYDVAFPKRHGVVSIAGEQQSEVKWPDGIPLNTHGLQIINNYYLRKAAK